MNVRLLRKIAKVIQEKPRVLFDMDNGNMDGDCGTPHCIMGWAHALTGVDSMAALGLTADQWLRLYHVSEWPERFATYRRKPVGMKWSLITPKQAAARIEHFIKTGGAE